MGILRRIERVFGGTVLAEVIWGDNLDAILGDRFWEKILTFGEQFWRTFEDFGGRTFLGPVMGSFRGMISENTSGPWGGHFGMHSGYGFG